MTVSSGSYLRKNRHNTFYFRRWVPLDLRGPDSPPEISFSLRTRDRRVAEWRGMRVLAATETRFERLRDMRKKLKKSDAETIRIEYTISGSPEGGWTLDADPEEGDAPIEVFDLLLARQAQRAAAHRSAAERSPVPGGAGDNEHVARVNADSGERLSSVIGKYIDANSQWAPSTRKAYEGDLRQICQIMRDPVCSEISVRMVREAQDTLLKLPANLNKNPEFRDKSIQEVLDLRLPPQTRSSVERKWSTLSAFFDWAKAREYVEKNFARDMKVKASGESYQKFTEDDLRKIFEGAFYSRREYEHAYQYWVPVLGLFTGARLEELCQLEVADVREVEGIRVIQITAESEGHGSGGGKRLKNASSERICPLHPELERLGFMEFVADRRAKQERALFPELKATGHKKRGAKASEWFTEYRRSIGVGEAEGRSKKTFHSFRHTANTTMQRAKVPQEHREAIVGHASKAVNTRIYGGDIPTAHLLEAVKAISYPITIPPYIPYRTGAGNW